MKEATEIKDIKIISGYIYKKKRFVPLVRIFKKRFFVLNPFQGTLIRYKRSEDFPFSPLYFFFSYTSLN